jgi:tetratricopeptide (TPR) repeat protein
VTSAPVRAGRTRPSARPAALLALASTLALAGCGDRPADAQGDAAPLPFPPPPATEPATVAAADFVGAEACRACHASQYVAWAGSTHGRAGGLPAAGNVIAAFDGTPLTFADAVVLPQRREGAYRFVVRQQGHDEVVFDVDAVVGGAHLLGGGSQGYLTRSRDGTVRFLPFDWSGTESTWFCNTGSRLDQGWVPVTPALRLADCGDWPPTRVLGTLDRFANCQECHGSQIRAGLDPAGAGYRTEWTSLAVNCESCHGPGREHVERAEAGDADPAAALRPPSLATLDVDASLQVCWRCHALKDVLREGYLPGEPLERFYALKFPVLGDDPYLPDGRVRTFAYQEGHLASACYLDGPMDCVSCHEPHGQGYRDAFGRPLDDPLDDGQCTACHASKARNPEAHTFHPAGSEGSRCVSCHMPYLQHPEVGPGIPFARSDHTIPVPRPALSAQLGVRGACASCHADATPAELQARAEAWWGELRPPRATVRGLLEVDSGAPALEAASALLHPAAGDPLLQFQGLARFLTGWLRPDDPGLPDEIGEALRALAGDPDLDVRALALASLHWSLGDDPGVRATLLEALAAPGAEALRPRWRLALGFLGDRARDLGRLGEGRAAYRKALELSPDDPDLLAALGLLHTRAGDPAAADLALRRSLERDPSRPLTWVNLGIARAALGDPAGAAESYARALRLDEHEPLAHFNLGNLRLRAGDLPAAVEAYRRAVEADPGLAPAHFNLARALIQMERIPEALPHARRAVEFDPTHDAARQMLEDLERALAGR